MPFLIYDEELNISVKENDKEAMLMYKQLKKDIKDNCTIDTTGDGFSFNYVDPSCQQKYVDNYKLEVIAQEVLAPPPSSTYQPASYSPQPSMDYGLYIIILIAMVVAIPIAALSQQSFAEKCKACKPFTWGFWQGTSGLILGIGSTLLGSYLFVSTNKTEEAIFVFSVGILAIVLGIFINKRSRWAFVIHTIITINPLVWLINGIYIKNRWDELARVNSSTLKDYSEENPIDLSTAKEPENTFKLTRQIRINIVIYIAYLIIWTCFVIFAEPFGCCPNDMEEIFIFLMYVAPVIGYLFWKLSMKFINAADD